MSRYILEAPARDEPTVSGASPKGSGPLRSEPPNQKLRVVQVSTNDDTGGAARAATRLANGLRDLGHDSQMFVLKKRSGEPWIRAFEPGRGFMQPATRRIRRRVLQRKMGRYRGSRAAGRGAFSTDRTSLGREPVHQILPADIINLHWVSNFVDLEGFWAACPLDIPVFWTLHDMNTFTGGCHYDHGCGRHREKCGACPALGSSQEKDLSRSVWERKRAVFQSLSPERLHVVTPSRWLASEVKSSSLIGERFQTTVIPNGLDPETFAPRDRAAAREVLGLPQDAKIVLFAAHFVTWGRKGFQYLLEALERLGDVDGVHLLSLGAGTSGLVDSMGQTHLGYVSNSRFMSMVYSAADVFVIPSLQDNLPNTVQEAMACATPVVGFDVGGIADMVRPGVTGELAPVADAEALAAAIRSLLTAPERARAMGEEARRVALAEYTVDRQARAYAELYVEALAAIARVA